MSTGPGSDRSARRAEADRRYLERAIELARCGLGAVSPRPSVGAVIVRDGAVVGEGVTQPVPGPHAEVVALGEAGEAARGATVYTTLEPCSHTDVTGPCAEALIEAGIARVVSSLEDPDPRVLGAGFRRLRAAGVDVDNRLPDDLTDAARETLEGFLHAMTVGGPFVTAKFAASLDGRVATRTGDSQWITGEAARARAHELRAAADAVVVGIGTVLADDPRLTARLPGLQGRPRLRVVVDSNGRLPASARLLGEPGAVLWARAEGCTARVESRNVETVELPRADGGVDLAALMQELGRRGCLSVLVEGGPTLLGSLFDSRLVQKVIAFIAPVVIGGAGALPAIGGTGPGPLADALRLERMTVSQLGADLLVTGYVASGAPGAQSAARAQAGSRRNASVHRDRRRGR